MQQTLFSIPHDWFAGPLLVMWLIIGCVILGFQYRRHGATGETLGFLPVFAVVAFIIWTVLPQLEVLGVNPDDPNGPLVKTGLAIRGYGLFMMLGIAAGTGLVLWRCRQANVDPDKILTLAFWMVICGIVGARLFYVIQKQDEFLGNGLTAESLVAIVDMTKGGLVVYGSLIGGVLAALVFFRMTGMKVGETADLMAPGMVLGLAFGRIGCLMNGCCFGGVCASELPAIHFPPGSPPYMQQLEEGQLLGLQLKRFEQPVDEPHFDSLSYPFEIQSVAANSLGEQLKLQVGERINLLTPDSLRIRYYKDVPPEDMPNSRQLAVYVDSQSQGPLPIPLARLPIQSLGVHPTQIYSAITAALLCATLWFYWPVRKSDGEVFALMLILYPIARFLMEIIRRDELGQFGTDLTISQWVSMVTIAIGFALFGWFRSTGPRIGFQPVAEM